MNPMPFATSPEDHHCELDECFSRDMAVCAALAVDQVLRAAIEIQMLAVGYSSASQRAHR